VPRTGHFLLFWNFCSRLQHGKFIFHRVLSAADGRFSQSLLLGKAEGDTRQSFHPQDLSDQPVQVNIGLAEAFAAEDGPVTYILTDSLTAAGREHNKITVPFFPI
jgi:hypothetical protein